MTGPVTDPSPVTLGQERIWLQDRLDPGNGAYNMFLVRRLRGALDVEAFRRALGDVVARHEPLRTVFTCDAAGAVGQRPLPAAPVPVELVDVGTPAEAHRAVGERTNAPFDLAAGPPLRASLLRLGERDHVVVIVVHHIVCDGWSMDILMRELAGRYAAHRDGVDAPQPALPAGYTGWAAGRRAAGIDEATRAYWHDRLDGAADLRLPADRSTDGPGTAGAYHTHRLPPELTERIERLARSARCSLFMTLMAAYQALLHRYTGQDDLCVGTFTAGREELATEPLIGCFINTVVLRADLGGDPTMRELLASTRSAALAAYARPHIPFEELPSRHTLLRTTLVLQNPGGSALDLPGLAVEPFDDGHRHCKVDLAVEAWREEQGLTLHFGYRTGLFSAAAVARLAQHLEAVLHHLVLDPDARVSQLRLLRPGEREQLLRWAAGDGDAATSTVPELIGTGGAVAVRQGATEITYAELRRRAGALAARLREAGVAPGATVGLCAEPSVELVVAMLAAWRAGAAYLPLDPRYPPARLDHLVRDGGIEVALCPPDLRDRLPDGLRMLDPADLPAPPGDADAPVRPDATAYVIYTSGSTGRPKGVRVSHRALAARVRWMRAHYALTPDDRVLQFASPSFDTHAEEIFPALAAGASVVLRERPGALLPEILAGAAVTVLDLPTAYWHELVAAPVMAWPARLRLLILGGDQADASALRRWHATHGERVRVVNTYGPTEATIVATAHDVHPPDAGRIVPIGRPLPGVRAYVLDERLEPVAVGVAGELYLGGAGLADGYHRRPSLTAQRFGPDPFGPPGSRMYRTGDRARWGDDGTLTFLGRSDDQVKIRGYRIETGEVRAHLLTHPDVGGAAVVARTVTAGDRQLVAYLVPRNGRLDEPAVREHLLRTLPEHMVPTQFVVLDALPLTAHGKLDARALPEPVPHRPAGTVYVAPGTAAERLVAEVWCEVLGVDRAGADDDFFALGGHSLLATRVITRLGAAVELEIPLRTLFTHRTVAALAEAVEDLIRADLDRLTEEEALAMLGGFE